MRNFLKALTVITLSTVTFGCQQLQSADRGLYNVANSVTQRDTVTGQRNVNMSNRAQQIQQGNANAMKVVDEYRNQGAPINGQIDAAQYSRLTRIFSRLHAVSHFKDENWSVYMIPDDSFNAFTTGGTIVVVHYGLMKALSSDDAVAGVIGHEMAHVSAGHLSEGQGQKLVAQLTNSKSAQTEAYQAGYSVNNETEADEIGILYAALAGYDPYASVAIWQNIYQKNGLNGQYYTSHPLSRNRAAHDEQVAQKVSQYYIKGQVNPNAQAILNNNSLYSKHGDFIEAGQGGGLASVLETAAGFYMEHKNAKAAGKQQTAQITQIKDIQSNLRVVGQEDLNNSQFAVGINYTGLRPVDSLAIKAVGKNGESLYRANKTINPGETFTAVFSKNILSSNDADNRKLGLIVDEGYLK